MRPFTPQCPGCRYDLSGEAARWDTQCPLHGTCPECGSSIRWAFVLSPAGRLRWAYDLPGVNGAALRRWWGTTLRTLRPSVFWRGLADQPIAPRRALLWLAMLIVQFHLLNVAMVLLQWTINVARSSSHRDPFPFWQNASVALEMFLAPHFDAGEITASGLMAPMYFTDRLRIALACGSLASGAFLCAYALIRPDRLHRASLVRATIYGLMPLAFMYAFQSGWTAIQLTLEHVIRVPMPWWYGWRTPTGRTPGIATWMIRLYGLACVGWVGIWWWHAAAAICPLSPQRTRIAAVTIALAVAGLLYISYLLNWNRWVAI